MNINSLQMGDEQLAKLMNDMKELKRYREREPLVKQLLSVWAMGWTNNAGRGGVTLDMVDEAVRDFCISGASTDVASEANAAASSGAEPTK